MLISIPIPTVAPDKSELLYIVRHSGIQSPDKGFGDDGIVPEGTILTKTQLEEAKLDITRLVALRAIEEPGPRERNDWLEAIALAKHQEDVRLGLVEDEPAEMSANEEELRGQVNALQEQMDQLLEMVRTGQLVPANPAEPPVVPAAKAPPAAKQPPAPKQKESGPPKQKESGPPKQTNAEKRAAALAESQQAGTISKNPGATDDPQAQGENTSGNQSTEDSSGSTLPPEGVGAETNTATE